MGKKENGNREVKKNILIICEGESEQAYFKDLKNRKDLKFSLKPELADKSSYKEIFEKAKRNNDPEIYEHIYCLVDLDHIINHKSYLKYEKAKRNLLKDCKIVSIIESCPCFELWICLHFEKTQSSETMCETFIHNKLKKHIPNYEKNMENLYTLTEDKMSTALKNANEINENRKNQIENETYANHMECTLSHTLIPKIILELNIPQTASELKYKKNNFSKNY